MSVFGWLLPALLATVAFCVLAWALWLTFGGGRGQTSAPATSLDDRLRAYLTQAFPGQAVLFRQPLWRLVGQGQEGGSVSAHHPWALRVVDCAVCGFDDKVAYAFELDILHMSVEEARQDAHEKYTVLKAAASSIRLVRLKHPIDRLSDPAEFRRRLEAMPPRKPSVHAPIPVPRPEWEWAEEACRRHSLVAQRPEFADSLPISESGLMNLLPVSGASR
jgi:hypothetical protein